MGQRLLQREPLFIKALPLAPQLERHLPRRLLFAAHNLLDLVQPPVMMGDQSIDSSSHIRKWAAVGR